MFYAQRAMDVPDGLPKWEKMQNDSKLLEDSPVEMVKDLERKRLEHGENEKIKKQKHSEKAGEGANTS
jgi:hypothetical protein